MVRVCDDPLLGVTVRVKVDASVLVLSQLVEESLVVFIYFGALPLQALELCLVPLEVLDGLAQESLELLHHDHTVHALLSRELHRVDRAYRHVLDFDLLRSLG